MTTNGKSQSKKRYASPSLQVYGNIRALTKSIGPNGMGDGGMAGASKS